MSVFVKGPMPAPHRAATPAVPPRKTWRPKVRSEFDPHTDSCFSCIGQDFQHMDTNIVLRHLAKCLGDIIDAARRDFERKTNTLEGRAHVQKNCIGPIVAMIAGREDITMLVTNGNGDGGASGMRLADQVRQDFVKILVSEFKKANKYVVARSDAFRSIHNRVPGENQLHVRLEPDSFRREVYPDGSSFTLSDSASFDPRVMGIAIGSKAYPGQSVYFKSSDDDSVGNLRVSPPTKGERNASLIASRIHDKPSVFKADHVLDPMEYEDTSYLNEPYTALNSGRGEPVYQQADLKTFYEKQDALAGRRVTRRY